MAAQFSIQDKKPWKATFFTIWGGQALSILGTQLVQFALIWYLTVQMSASTSLMVPVEQLTRIQGLNQLLNGGLNIIAAPLGALLLGMLPMVAHCWVSGLGKNVG